MNETQKKSWLARHKGAIKLVGVLIFVYILAQIDLGKSLRLLAGVHLGYLLLALALGVPAILLKALRWWTLLRNQGIPLPLKDTVALYCIGLFGGFVTPGQLGDFVKVYYLRQGGQSLARSFSSVLYDRLFDVLVFGLFGLAGLAVLFGFASGHAWLWAAAGAGVLGSVWLFRARLVALVSAWSIRHLMPRLSQKVQSRLYDFMEISREVFKRRLFKVLFGYSFAAMTLYLFRVYLLALALDLHVPVLDFLASIAVVSLVTIVPISVADVGTRDGALILLLARLGVESEVAVSLSLLILLLAVLNGAIGFVFWVRHPAHAQARAPEESLTLEEAVE